MDNYNLLLDTETLRTALHFDAGVYDGMEVGIEVPFLRLDTGFMDAFLQKYHTTFGFPNAGREKVPNGGFTYRLSRDGTAIYDVATQEDFGLGDVTLNFKHNFWEEKDLRPAVAWLFYFKLPTGDRGEGLGSGNPDFGFGAAFEKNRGRWHGYLNLAYFVNGGHGPLQGYIYDQYFSYVAGGEYSLSRPVSVIAQIYGGSPLLKNTGMPQWDWVPLDLQIGLKGGHSVQRLFKGGSKIVQKQPDKSGPKTTFEQPLNNISSTFKRFTWQLGFSEDLNANGPSIDLTILGSVGMRY